MQDNAFSPRNGVGDPILQKDINYEKELNMFTFGAGMLALCGLIFLFIGVFILDQNDKIFTVRIQYDNQPLCVQNSVCNVTFEITSDVSSQIFVSYELSDYYQNDLQYMDSFSPHQFRGESQFQKSDCYPIISNQQLQQMRVVQNLDPNQDAIPCGLLPTTMFNDSFRLFQLINNTEYEINIVQNGIAWDQDKNAAIDIDLSKQWISMKDEHLLVWMRIAPTPNFVKLWGTLGNQRLKSSQYILEITNNFSRKFQKFIRLETITLVGGNQYALSITFLISGCIFIALGLFLGILQKQLKEREKKQTIRYE